MYLFGNINIATDEQMALVEIGFINEYSRWIKNKKSPANTGPFLFLMHPLEYIHPRGYHSIID